MRKKRIFFMAVFVLFVFLFIFGMRLSQDFQQFRNTEAWAQSLREHKDNGDVNFLFIGINDLGATLFAESVVLLHKGEGGHTSAVFIPGATIISDLRECDSVRLLGEGYGTGGARLLIEQVEQLLGMPVHHYFSFYYDGLPSLVELLGGLPADAFPAFRGSERELAFTEADLVGGAELCDHFVIRAPGETSLEHLERQRCILRFLITALLEQTHFWQIPRTVSTLAPYIETDLSWREIIAFYRSFDYDNVYLMKLPVNIHEGEEQGCVQGYIPDKEEIRETVRLIAEGLHILPSVITVEILNGSGLPGIAALVRDKLKDKGFEVVRIDDAAHFNHQRSKVISRQEHMEAAKAVALVIPGADLFSEPKDGCDLQVTIIIGHNYPAAAAFEGSED